jgi:hypothetical protein
MSHLPQSQRGVPTPKTASSLDTASTPEAEGGLQRSAPAFQLQGAARPKAKPASGKGLPPEMIDGFLLTTGVDLSEVPVFYNSPKPQKVQAHALADEEGIHLGEGQEAYLYEEAAHKVQQLQGKVHPTTDVNGTAINAEASMEGAAIRMGEAAKAATQQPATQQHPQTAAPVSAPATKVAQRAINPTAQDYKDYATLSVMTIGALEKYAQLQADWHVSSKLTDPERDILRGLLDLARQPDILAGCFNMKASDVQAEIALSGMPHVLKYLGHYAQAVKRKPFQISPVTAIKDAILSGQALEILKAGFPEWVLGSAMLERDFKYIRDGKLAADVVNYYATSVPQPIFQANNGMDFISFYNMKAAGGVDPLKYSTSNLKGNVRNFHRFEPAALDQLDTNAADLSKSKPLILILHSTVDHNGAFHRDKELTKVIKNTTNNTIMLEGKESLADVQAEIPTLAKKYGKNDKIDQVMVAGHGNSNVTQMAGKVEEDPATHKLREVGDDINLSTNLKASEALFNEILNNMDKLDPVTGLSDPNRQTHRRILFNACLTGSNNISGITLDPDPKIARPQITAWLSTNKNLVDWVTGLAATNKGDDIKGVGSVASFSVAGLMNATGGLDINSTIDPKITASKLEYVEEGKEPLGALRAVLESWSKDEAKTKLAMQSRIAKPLKTWDGVLIQSLYDLIINSFWTNANAIQVLGQIAGILAETKQEPHCRVEQLYGAETQTVVEPVWLALEKSDEYLRSPFFIQLVMQQGRMTMNGVSKGEAKFYTALETFTCQSAQKYVDIKYLIAKSHLGPLLKGSASKGRTMLALLTLLEDKTNASATKYLTKQLDAKDQFPSVLGVNALLGGLATEDDILRLLGKLPPLPTSSATTVATPKTNQDANMSQNKEAQNTEYVQSITKRGEITAPTAKVFKDSGKATEIGTLSAAAKVNIFGSTSDCWAIEHQQDPTTPGAAFVLKADVKLL